MGEIILLEKYQDMKQKKRESTEDIAALLSYMASEVSKILDKPRIEMMEEREIQERKRIEERYKDVLLRAPDHPETQIQYFAGIMSEFLPVIFPIANGISDLMHIWTFLNFTCPNLTMPSTDSTWKIRNIKKNTHSNFPR